MSLDIDLIMKDGQQSYSVNDRIFVRENGQGKEITRKEWDTKYPDREPIVTELSNSENGVYGVYWANITHNLGKMANEAGIYKHLWRPEEINISKAGQLIEPLQVGLELLRSDPERFRKLNPSNGWGTYEGLVEFVEKYLKACQEYPDTDIETWR